MLANLTFDVQRDMMFLLNGYGRNYESDRALNFKLRTVVFNLP